MIISASRRTDIAAFYPDWFMNRIREGYALVQNPYDVSRFSRVDLSPAQVDAIAFFTKNCRPFLKYLDELSGRGFKYYFHHTLNRYPALLEPGVPSPQEAIEAFKGLSRAIGSEKVIWRFDPIAISDVTQEDWICDNFRELAAQLEEFTHNVTISFLEFYGKVRRNLSRITARTGVRFYDLHKDPEAMMRIASRLAEIARCHSMTISSCAELPILAEAGITPGQCISDEVISRLFGITVDDRKDKYQRKACRCVGSRDVGRYDTCTHGCIYCYANSDWQSAGRNHVAHDPSSPTLIGPGPLDAHGVEDRQPALL